ncbi:MAG: hypothetical protein SchgKO_02720 [Schleiferiaceae bacterium]
MHILMSKRFYFPEGLYYWGQNRLGSVVPLIAHPFVSFGLNPLWVISIIQTLLIWFTFKIFSFGLPGMGKIAVALFLFLPLSAWNYLISTGQPYIPQILFFSILYRLLLRSEEWSSTIAWQFTFTAWASLYVSDLSIVYILPMVAYVGWNQSRLGQLIPWIKQSWKAFSGGIIGGLLLLVLKNQLPRAKGYEQIMGPTEEWVSLFEGLSRFYKGYFTNFEHHPFETVGVWFLLILFLFMLTKRPPKSFAVLYFSLCLVTCFLLTSHWVYVNGLRYFALPFSLLVILTVIRIFSLKKTIQKTLGSLALASGLLFAIGNVKGRLASERPASFMPKTAEVVQLANQYSLPAIGDYWIVYVYSAYAENQPLAIADENWAIRNYWEKDAVINSDTLLIFESPRLTLEDEIVKFKKTYIAVSSPSHIGETSFRLYVPVGETP